MPTKKHRKQMTDLDNMLQKKIKKAKTKKEKGKYKKQQRKLHEQWTTATNEKKQLEKLIKKYKRK